MLFFANFVSQGVNDLVLDLRYNPGGKGSTAAILASSVKGTNTSDLLYKTVYNAKLQAEFGRFYRKLFCKYHWNY